MQVTISIPEIYTQFGAYVLINGFGFIQNKNKPELFSGEEREIALDFEDMQPTLLGHLVNLGASAARNGFDSIECINKAVRGEHQTLSLEDLITLMMQAEPIGEDLLPQIDMVIAYYGEGDLRNIELKTMTNPNEGFVDENALDKAINLMRG